LSLAPGTIGTGWPVIESLDLTGKPCRVVFLFDVWNVIVMNYADLR
jgi:hypothetical protein